MRELASARIRYGYREIRVLLNREGWNVGKKLVYRYRLYVRHFHGTSRLMSHLSLLASQASLAVTRVLSSARKTQAQGLGREWSM